MVTMVIKEVVLHIELIQVRFSQYILPHFFLKKKKTFILTTKFQEYFNCNILFLAHLAKGNVIFCHHLASVVH
jgi:hypothetical protein